MLKSVTKWLLKKVLTKDMIKKAVWAANEKIASMVINGDRIRVAGWMADATSAASIYSNAFRDDGMVSAKELQTLNGYGENMVDKYIPDDKALGEFIDTIFKERD